MGNNVFKDTEHLNYKLKTYNNLDLSSKLKMARELKGSVINLVYYNLLRGLKSSFKSECLRMGKDSMDSLYYKIITGDYVLSIPLYDLDALRIEYADNVESVCMPESIEPLKEGIYAELDRYEDILYDGVTLKGFLSVYKGSKIGGFFICLFNKREAIKYVSIRANRLKRLIDEYTSAMRVYNDKYSAYSKRIDSNISFLSSISEDIVYLQSEGFTVDIML